MSSHCRFFSTPQGCREGARCNFSHSPLSSPTGRGRGRGGHASARGRGGASSPPPSPASSAPRGVCNFYWTSGRCTRKFDCRFSHVSSSSDSQRATLPPTPPGTGQTAPLLTNEGLTRLSGSGTDVFFSQPSNPRTPTDTHNYLKKYLHDNFRFSKTFDVYAFVTLLSNINTSNNGWVSVSAFVTVCPCSFISADR